MNSFIVKTTMFGLLIVLAKAVFVEMSVQNGSMIEMSAVEKKEFELRRVSVHSNQESSSRGSGTIILGFGYGNYTSQSSTKTTIRIAWKSPTGEFVISTIPIQKVRIQIDDSKINPTIKFNTDMDGWYVPTNNTDYSDIINRRLKWATIVCNSSDFKTDINLNSI